MMSLKKKVNLNHPEFTKEFKLKAFNSDCLIRELR